MMADVTDLKRIYRTPVQGEFHLLIPRPLAAMIAETIIALNMAEVEEQQLEDVATELLNTMAGKFLNDFLPKDETYKLGLPVIERTGVDEPNQPVCTWSFQMAELVFTLTISETLLEKGNVTGETGKQT